MLLFYLLLLSELNPRGTLVAIRQGSVVTFQIPAQADDSCVEIEVPFATGEAELITTRRGILRRCIDGSVIPHSALGVFNTTSVGVKKIVNIV